MSVKYAIIILDPCPFDIIIIIIIVEWAWVVKLNHMGHPIPRCSAVIIFSCEMHYLGRQFSAALSLIFCINKEGKCPIL